MRQLANIGPSDDCPCDSGKKAAVCCARGNLITPRQHLPPDRSAKTGHRHERCYAKGLLDCSSVISREHYVSAALLRRISSNGMIKVRGFPWLGEEWKEVPVASFGSKILCRQHNLDLGGLDSTADRLASRVERLYREASVGDETAWAWIVNGHDIERWLLKTLCGLIASGSVLDRDGSVMAQDVPAEWVRILYGLADFPPTWGLYLFAREGHQYNYKEGKIDLSIVWTHDGLAGIAALIGCFEFILIMRDVPSNRDGARAGSIINADSIYRVSAMVMKGRRDETKRKVMCFHWDTPGEGASIDLVPPVTVPDETACPGAAG